MDEEDGIVPGKAFKGVIMKLLSDKGCGFIRPAGSTSHKGVHFSFRDAIHDDLDVGTLVCAEAFTNMRGLLGAREVKRDSAAIFSRGTHMRKVDRTEQNWRAAKGLCGGRAAADLFGERRAPTGFAALRGCSGAAESESDEEEEPEAEENEVEDEDDSEGDDGDDSDASKEGDGDDSDANKEVDEQDQAGDANKEVDDQAGDDNKEVDEQDEAGDAQDEDDDSDGAVSEHKSEPPTCSADTKRIAAAAAIQDEGPAAIEAQVPRTPHTWQLRVLLLGDSDCCAQALMKHDPRTFLRPAPAALRGKEAEERLILRLRVVEHALSGALPERNEARRALVREICGGTAETLLAVDAPPLIETALDGGDLVNVDTAWAALILMVRVMGRCAALIPVDAAFMSPSPRRMLRWLDELVDAVARRAAQKSEGGLAMEARAFLCDAREDAVIPFGDTAQLQHALAAAHAELLAPAREMLMAQAEARALANGFWREDQAAKELREQQLMELKQDCADLD